MEFPVGDTTQPPPQRYKLVREQRSTWSLPVPKQSAVDRGIHCDQILSYYHKETLLLYNQSQNSMGEAWTRRGAGGGANINCIKRALNTTVFFNSYSVPELPASVYLLTRSHSRDWYRVHPSMPQNLFYQVHVNMYAIHINSLKVSDRLAA